MKRIALLFVVLTLTVCWAWSAGQQDDIPRRVFRQFGNLMASRPQEKVYLHTDRDYYEAGERIWFRAYVQDAYTHRTTDLSEFVYVELRNRQDSLMKRVKIARRDSVFSGYMDLETGLPQGDYSLRAFTYWMQNAGDAFIFRKRIGLINPRSSKVQVSVDYEEGARGGYARIRFFNKRGDSFAGVRVGCNLDGRNRTDVIGKDGSIRFRLDSADYGRRMLVCFKDEDLYRFSKYVYLPDPDPDVQVAFMPEGGNLLEGCRQRVAFKVIGKDGLSREAQGNVYNASGEMVAVASTLYKGMGAFELETVPGETYHAEFVLNDGFRKRVELPVPVSEGLALRVLELKGMLVYTVLSANGKTSFPPLYLVAHTRGTPQFCVPVTVGSRGKIPVDSLSEGILHLSLINTAGTVYSDRLNFVYPKRGDAVDILTDKEGYGVREPVHLSVQVAADSLNTRKGSFSLAVTDDSQFGRDSLQGNILSGLLLTSDLKGYVEEPAWYFSGRSAAAPRMLDLLMMTQGWSRFSVERVLKNRLDTLTYYLEKGQAISGCVKNFWGRKAKEAQLFLMSNNGIFRYVQADASGRFMIKGIAFPDSTDFILQGQGKTGRKNVEVLVDEDEYLPLTCHIPLPRNRQTMEDAFYDRFSRDYYYDNGVKVYVLDEVVIRRKKDDRLSFYDRVADHRMDSARLSTMKDWDIRRILQEFPGMEPMGDTLKRYGKPVYILVNDIEEQYLFVQEIDPVDLVNICYITPPNSYNIFGYPAEHGAIIFTTRMDYHATQGKPLNLVSFSLLGYQKQAEFYRPRYEVDSVRLALRETTDRRRTIYWDPDLRTDEDGKVECSFCTSDSYGPYTIILEGILEDGTVCRKEKRLQISL